MPPSSIESRSSVSDAWPISVRPTSVEPVNDIFRSRGSAISGPVVLEDEDAVKTLSTPPGSPASCRICASASIDSGVWPAGLTTIVQPAATAGPILRVPIAIGKFQGVIIRHGPTGCFMVRIRPAPLAAVVKRPSIRTASSENQRRNSAA